MTSSVANIVNTTPSVTSDTASKASSSSRSSTTTECSSVEEVVIHDQPEEEGIELSLQNFEPNSNYCLRWDFFSFSNYLFSIEASKAPLRRSRMEAIKTMRASSIINWRIFFVKSICTKIFRENEFHEFFFSGAFLRPLKKGRRAWRP